MTTEAAAVGLYSLGLTSLADSKWVRRFAIRRTKRDLTPCSRDWQRCAVTNQSGGRLVLWE